MPTVIPISLRNNASIYRMRDGKFMLRVSDGKWARQITMTRDGMIALANEMLREADHADA